MSATSAGILLYRVRDGALEVLLAHPGGPYFRKKDLGAWTVPKGELEGDEQPLACALREFKEETGITLEDASRTIALGEIKQRGGKRVFAFAWEGDFHSDGPPPCNTFEIEWPPRSKKLMSFPEIDRLEFFALPAARLKILEAQSAFLDRLLAALAQR
jgi:predicted NUDIX family NTP pyrophosphohydrolase